MSHKKINIYVNAVQILFGLSVFLMFCVAFFLLAGKNTDSMGPIMAMTAKAAILPIIIYLLNYSILVPGLFFRNRKLLFFGLDVAVVLLAAFLPFVFMQKPQPDEMEQLSQQLNGLSLQGIFYGAVIIRILLYVFMIALAVGMRYITRWYEERKKLEEERRRNAEAELNWLKNQLNPHFLFNTLNNISSLVKVDADKAQESICQLSELLRYALYESNTAKVKVRDEMVFLRNYIDLMSLRCNDKTMVDVRFGEFDDSVVISPLLFIPLVENAFKHGTSAHLDSFVRIEMVMDGDDMLFSCVNTIIKSNTINYSGSGIGLENMRRRLELLYVDSYAYEVSADEDMYRSSVRIKNLKQYA